MWLQSVREPWSDAMPAALPPTGSVKRLWRAWAPGGFLPVGAAMGKSSKEKAARVFDKKKPDINRIQL